jgi:hypothetical protein
MKIDDSDGKLIDVNTVVKAKMTGLITSMIGAINYAALTKKFVNLSFEFTNFVCLKLNFWFEKILDFRSYST